MTYDLRRLRRKGLIRRIPRSQRYELTAFGRRTAVFFTKTYVRIVNPSLAELDPQLPEEIANQQSDRPRMARVRARARRQDQTGRYRGLKRDSREGFNDLAELGDVGSSIAGGLSHGARSK